MQFGFISCDIVGHSAVNDLATQRRRIAGLNALVRQVLEAQVDDAPVWASGGDGGHLAFRHQGWIRDSLEFIVALRVWSAEEGLHLRIVAHVGDVDCIIGADGRDQLVGDGINLAGRLLKAAPAHGVLITDAFREELVRAKVPGVRTRNARALPLKYFPNQLVFLLSMEGAFDSAWDGAENDRSALMQSLVDGHAWEALYFGKRLLQNNSVDDEVEDALDRLGPHLLVYQAPTSHNPLLNPFLAELSQGALKRVLRTAQLVERRQGEFVCEEGDAGDAMFIVLRGSIGAFLHAPEVDPNPHVKFGAGELVGELAFALQRPRTATLLAVEDAALLAVNAADLKALSRDNTRLASSLDKFLTQRVLEYACRVAAYLVGETEGGPLAEISQRGQWDRLSPFADLIECSLADPRPISLEDQRFARDGLYLLVGGRLRSTIHGDKVIDAATAPLVYVDLPGRVVCPDHAYRAEGSDALLLRIGQEAFLGRKPVVDAVANRVIRELSTTYHFDVFVSYNFEDEVIARRWRSTLEDAGLRVYMETATGGHYFRDKIRSAILDSLVLLTLVSAHTMSRPAEENWVKKEIDFRMSAFDSSTARIVPVRLKGGAPEHLADGYTIIEGVNREEAAMREVVETVQRIKSGELAAPFALARKPGLNIRA